MSLLASRMMFPNEVIKINGSAVEATATAMIESGYNSIEAMVLGVALAAELHKVSYLDTEGAEADFLDLCKEIYHQSKGKMFKLFEKGD